MSFPGDILAEIGTLLHEGGPFFVSLIVLAFGIAFALLALWNSMQLPDAPVLKSSEWRALLLGLQNTPPALLQHIAASSDQSRSLQEIGQRLFAKPERRFPFAFVLIGAAPLIGLLGTVSGMLQTFQGMSATATAAPIDVISDGISEALITTQTGLIIGVPTFIVCSWLKSRHDELLLRFRRLESQLLQSY